MPVIGPAAAFAGEGWVKAPFETTARYRFALWASLCARLAALNIEIRACLSADGLQRGLHPALAGEKRKTCDESAKPLLPNDFRGV